MTREEAIINLKLSQNRIGGIKKEEWNALQMAIEALSAEEAVWNEYEAEFTDLPDIPRYYYEKVVGKMAHEINMLKEQLESADAEQGVGRYENAMQKLREMPRYLNGVKEKQITKISAEAVQGEWIHDGQSFKGGLDWCHCSECGYETSTNGLSVYRYCPSCGARMKGGAE